MNLLNKNTAKLYVSVIFLIALTVMTSKVHAQKQYTTISKNINPDAASLDHDLSVQGDSLFLKNESIFYKVTFLNSMDRQVFKFNPPVKQSKISLQNIIVGDYTVLVYAKDRIIVFHISRLLEIEKQGEMIAFKEAPLAQLSTSGMNDMKPALNEVKINQVKIENYSSIESDENQLAVNDDNLNAGQSTYGNESKTYNLTSADRSNIQTRDDYRRNNLRPNGKPYY